MENVQGFSDSASETYDRASVRLPTVQVHIFIQSAPRGARRGEGGRDVAISWQG
jgi:hypothetical protein